MLKFKKDRKMTSYSDETLLSVGMYMISRGESESRVVAMLIHFGWDEITAKKAVHDIARFSPKAEKSRQPTLWSFLWALIVTTFMVLVLCDFLLPFPDQWVWRIPTAMGLAILIPAIFFGVWLYFSPKS